MQIIVISIDHELQVVEEEKDSVSLNNLKQALRKLLDSCFADNEVDYVFEESSPTRQTIAAELLAKRYPLSTWTNIYMTEEQRRAAGIYEALRNRPGRPNWDEDDDSPRMIERRIPEDTIREDFFVSEILKAESSPNNILVLLGDMHIIHVAEKLRALGHEVTAIHELIPHKRWEEIG